MLQHIVKEFALCGWTPETKDIIISSFENLEAGKVHKKHLWNIFKKSSYKRNSKLKWNVEKMAAFISAACHLFASRSSLFASFPGNEPNDISNNAKINMTMKMFLHSPYISFLYLCEFVFPRSSPFSPPPTPSSHRMAFRHTRTPWMCNVCIWI